MLSSISSFSAPRLRWWRVWLPALVCATVICGGNEYFWRAQGFRPQLRDSAQLWSLQRARVDSARRMPLVVLGASHIQYALDMHMLAKLLPDYEPIMLAYNGHYPLAALHDLSRDADFRGVVLCDIDARGLSTYYDDAQQPFVDYFHRQWSPSWHVHRVLLNIWQRTAVISWESFGVTAALTRWLGGASSVWRSPVTFRSNRGGDIDFTRVDSAAMAQSFVDGLHEDLLKHPPQPAAIWLANLERVRPWVQRIQQRGGKVIFFRTPTSGALHRAEMAAYPRDAYWDRLASRVGAPAVFATDMPFFAALHLGDGSHVDYHEKPAYTQALVTMLDGHGWVRR